jgi:drug/metabolite transporter (DMT)-like permease
MAMGQNYSPPTHAAIILSLEGVFASISSYLFLGEVLSMREIMGCLLMLISTLVAKVCSFLTRLLIRL